MRNITISTLKFAITAISTLAFLWGGTTGKISGRATDANTGEPLIGCNIIIEEIGLGAASDLDGNYFIINIPPGAYTVKAIMIGYTTVRMTGLEVATDFTTQANFQLATEALKGQEVIVVAKSH